MIAAVSGAPSWLSVYNGNITPKRTKTVQLTIDAANVIPRNTCEEVWPDLDGFMQVDQIYLQ